MPIASPCNKISIEFICWNCLEPWISDTITRCPFCDSGNISTYPLIGKYKIKICLEVEEDVPMSDL